MVDPERDRRRISLFAPIASEGLFRKLMGRAGSNCVIPRNGIVSVEGLHFQSMENANKGAF